MFAANAIVAVYSFAEMGVSLWELIRGATPLPEPIQLWFDFSHDQVIVYPAFFISLFHKIKQNNIL